MTYAQTANCQGMGTKWGGGGGGSGCVGYFGMDQSFIQE